MEAENVIAGRRYGLQQAYVVHINKYITASIITSSPPRATIVIRSSSISSARSDTI